VSDYEKTVARFRELVRAVSKHDRLSPLSKVIRLRQLAATLINLTEDADGLHFGTTNAAGNPVVTITDYANASLEHEHGDLSPEPRTWCSGCGGLHPNGGCLCDPVDPTVCSECGSDEVEQALWVILKTNEINDSEGFGSHGNGGLFCPSAACEGNPNGIHLVSRSEYERRKVSG
jgi:hypothetical protein